MVLESTIVCVDNSEYMRNGDYFPTRLTAEIDAVNFICNAKTRSHPENTVGLVTMSNGRVLVTLTSQIAKVQANLHKLQVDGLMNFETGVRVAHLALKHRQGRNHKMRIVVFVGSPLEHNEKDLIKMAKRLKKEKVSVDIVSFGQEGDNVQKLEQFVHTLNGKDGSGSHLLVVPPGQELVDALKVSPVIYGEGEAPPANSDQHGGFDPELDPELAMALRVSMEEQRAREDNQRSATPGQQPAVTSEEQNHSQSVFDTAASEGRSGQGRDSAELHHMTEEEQLAYAMRLSLNENQTLGDKDEEPMDTDEPH